MSAFLQHTTFDLRALYDHGRKVLDWVFRKVARSIKIHGCVAAEISYYWKGQYLKLFTRYSLDMPCLEHVYVHVICKDPWCIGHMHNRFQEAAREVFGSKSLQVHLMTKSDDSKWSLEPEKAPRRKNYML